MQRVISDVFPQGWQTASPRHLVVVPRLPRHRQPTTRALFSHRCLERTHYRSQPRCNCLIEYQNSMKMVWHYDKFVELNPIVVLRNLDPELVSDTSLQ